MKTSFTALNSDQLRLLADAGNQYDQWIAAKREQLTFAGWMGWRTKNGTDYLTSSRAGGLSQKSHGARSPETEHQLQVHLEGKERSGAALRAIEERLGERAPLLKASRLGRVLAPLAQVVREFDVRGMLGSRLLVGGTHAITAYEAMAGQLFDSALTATEDLDFVWSGAKRAEFVVADSSPALLKHLKTVDSSYTVNTERNFQARNAKGLIIDFISDDIGVAAAPKEYLRPIALPGQEWLLQSDPVESVAIDTNGLPVRIISPDPRVFALHKAWVAERDDRNPLKRQKDLKQALAVSQLVNSYLPMFSFNDAFQSKLSPALGDVFMRIIQPSLDSGPSAEPIKM